MSEAPKFDREFIRTALMLGSKGEVDDFLYISDELLPPEELKGKAVRTKMIFAVTSEAMARDLHARKLRAIVLPTYDYSRAERVRIALLTAIGQGELEQGALVLCLTGNAGQSPDTLMYRRVGQGLGAATSAEQLGLGEPFGTQVMDALIQLGLEIGQEGFEGHPIGTIFTVGDHNTVLERSRQMTINPFQGLSESERNVLDPRIRDAIKNFSVLDGAFVIREDGVVLAAGRYLSNAVGDSEVPLGLGARHAASAAITAGTRCIALSVSQTSGKVRIFKGGKMMLELGRSARRRGASPEKPKGG